MSFGSFVTNGKTAKNIYRVYLLYKVVNSAELFAPKKLFKKKVELPDFLCRCRVGSCFNLTSMAKDNYLSFYRVLNI